VDAVAKAARETGRIVVAEEHLHSGALGAAVAQAVSQTCPVPMAYVDLGDRYAESGTPEELLEHYGMTGENIAAAARRLLG
jgi:transketolase